ncbi:MAG: PEP-CTERM sorting domain-containing protein [Candidatus Eisenbacteria bacterium]|uniref:PEP-CTERM sorting domain-containing protein n=1 Tax=Eiseniibacteriota bacterium TaxID=2212470 RepID=A0A7Y2H2M8_UNCEI|nr:PEP-CTERM sorting domain-containing protein [Candidatus Eisenbacteria bacterium]
MKHNRLIVSLAVLLASFTITSSAQAVINLNVMGRAIAEGSTGFGFGEYGLYLGDGQTQGHSVYNWRWDNMNMAINEANGNAQITGNMTRLYNDEIWGVTIDMSGLQWKDIHGNRSNRSSISMQDILNLKNNADGGTSYGFEWQNMSMSLTKPIGSTSVVPAEGWIGNAMANLGHVNVAELHYDSARGLTWESWYQNPSHGNQWYHFGDTKGDVDMNPIPEPATMMLLGLGLGAVGLRKKLRG